MTLSMFLPADQEQAKRELDSWGYSLKNAMEYQIKGDFKGAIVHLENAKRSLSELDTLKNQKEMDEQVWLIVKQIEGSRQHKELIQKLVGSQ